MPERTNRIGRHLRTSGGLAKTIETASNLGCETAQIFVSNPQGWAVPSPDCKCEVVRSASDRAKTARLGIWSSTFTMPWDWREAR